MQPAVSVIIPVHNNLPYLGALFAALDAQTLRGIELIFVDDGSRDGSDLALAEFVASRNHAQLVTHSTARGVAAARNTGLAQAAGVWIGFCDADDVPAPTLYETLLAAVEREQLDFVIANGARFFASPHDCADQLIRQPKPAEVVTGSAWLCHCIEQDEYPVLVYLTLSRRLHPDGSRITFPEGMVHEDIVWMTASLLKSQRLRFLDQPLYHYRYTPGSITQSVDEPAILRRIAGYERAADALEAFANHAPTATAIALRRFANKEAMTMLGMTMQLRRFTSRCHISLDQHKRGVLRNIWQRQTSFKARKRVIRAWLMAQLSMALPTRDRGLLT